MKFPRTEQMISDLRSEKVETWFDLGLLIDRLREDRPEPASIERDFEGFKRRIARGTAFVTFDYGVDGVTMEVAKYARSLTTVMPDANVHFIAGNFAALTETILSSQSPWHEIKEMNGFDRWPLYHDFFARKLDRGSKLYNKLIRSYWDAVIDLCERLGAVIEANDIQLLYLININSNPGNPALALAMVLISERFSLPVINNCHDFYWENGHSKIEREVLGLPVGIRDHFFTNAHVGEVFSLIEMVYPWEAQNWLTVCINAQQVDASIERFGANPANVCEICTGIDADLYAPMSRRHTKEVWRQLHDILRGSRKSLRAVTAEWIFKKDRLAPEHRHPILIAASNQTKVDFENHNMVFLQPTRILARKHIDFTFTLISSLLADDKFAAAFRADKSRKLTLLISGPVATGQEKYLKKLVQRFDRFVQKLDESFSSRVYLAMLFSEFDNPSYQKIHSHPIGMPELYNIASLVVLPSETEGRGLPIIEAAACAVPIFTRRYEPEEVFSAVIGEHLAREGRLQVSEFKGWKITPETVVEIRECLLHPEHFIGRGRHNRRVVQKRFSLGALARDLESFLHRLHCQMGSSKSVTTDAEEAFEQFDERVHNPGADFDELVSTKHREYLPGFGRMSFMLMLKSLIDPSYFRVEEQLNRGMAFRFARSLFAGRTHDRKPELADELDFFNRVDSLFRIRAGEMSIRIDHSMAYRHRNRNHYRYRDLTPQELTAVILLLDHKMFGPREPSLEGGEIIHQLASWKQMVASCCGGPLEIDDRDTMLARLSDNVPFALFLGNYTELQLETFVMQTVRIRLGLGIHDDLTAIPKDQLAGLAPITLIEREIAHPGGSNATAIQTYLKSSSNEELQWLYQNKICRIVISHQLSIGIDFRQLGEAALRCLLEIRERDGFMIALCDQAAMTTDGVAIERFHLGRADDPLSANILGIPLGSGFVQWAPAGLRSTLAYPTPVQTAQSLSATLHGRSFKKLCKVMGRNAVLTALKEDAEQRGTPVETVISRLSRSKSKSGPVVYEALNGLYEDGCPWSGVIANVPADSPLRYSILSASQGNQTVPEFVTGFNESSRRKARISWNGGYILNAELVGKLGLPESYIGSPLGLIVSQGHVLSPPLFDKPAFVVSEDGSLDIRRISTAAGLSARLDDHDPVEFSASSRNLASPGPEPCFYDLLHDAETLPGDGRIIIRLVGSMIMEVRSTALGETVPVLPVGLVLSFPKGKVPTGWVKGQTLTLEFAALAGIYSAIEAGPMLLENGEIHIDMDGEGWTTSNSIRTQAARLDFLDMRGPKIAIGLDAKGSLTVLVVNGRIRESVGATHMEMAEILRARGMRSAMGFDPGGSATLVVNGKILNISPYNQDYERNVNALPPQPRAVASAVIGY